MIIEHLEHDAAVAKAKQLPFAWIIALSSTYCGPTPEELDPTEWVEARFFDAKQELRFTAEDLRAALITREDGDLIIDKPTAPAQSVTRGFSASDQWLLIRKFIQTDEDEDGQACISAVCLAVKEDV